MQAVAVCGGLQSVNSSPKNMAREDSAAIPNTLTDLSFSSQHFVPLASWEPLLVKAMQLILPSSGSLSPFWVAGHATAPLRIFYYDQI